MESNQKKPDKYVCTLSPELLRKAREELNEDPERRERDIQELRERAENHPGLHARTDGAFLIRFLRARKFNIDRAFTTLVKYYEIQRDNPDIFENLQPSAIKHVLEDDVFTVLPDRDEQGCRVIIYRFGRWDPAKCSLIESCKESIITHMKLIEDEETQVNGIVFVEDLKNASLTQMYHITPGLVKRMFDLFQDCFPLRVKGMHYVHELSLFKYVFALIKPFVKQKLSERLHFHSYDFDSFHKFFKPDILPEEYGGTMPPLSNKDWHNILYSSEEEFIEERKYGFKKMVAEYNPNEQDAMDTLVGSFKKLET